jgi:hypothetical protein
VQELELDDEVLVLDRELLGLLVRLTQHLHNARRSYAWRGHIDLACGHLRLTAHASSGYGELHDVPPSRSGLAVQRLMEMPHALPSREAGSRRQQVVGGERCRMQEASGALVFLCLVQGQWTKTARARAETLRSSDIGIAEISHLPPTIPLTH